MPNSKENERSWRVGHQGRDRLYYEERRGGAWQRLAIDGEMLTGPAHHVIYLASPERWQHYPEWAHARRAEIIARIQSEFRAPDYEYLEANDAAASTPASVAYATSPNSPPTRAARVSASTQGRRALTVAVLLLLSITIAMAWLVARGIHQGETYFPSKRVSQQRVVTRAEEPATFWLALGLYSVISLGALGLSAWGIREGTRR